MNSYQIFQHKTNLVNPLKTLPDSNSINTLKHKQQLQIDGSAFVWMHLKTYKQQQTGKLFPQQLLTDYNNPSVKT